MLTNVRVPVEEYAWLTGRNHIPYTGAIVLNPGSGSRKLRFTGLSPWMQMSFEVSTSDDSWLLQDPVVVSRLPRFWFYRSDRPDYIEIRSLNSEKVLFRAGDRALEVAATPVVPDHFAPDPAPFDALSLPLTQWQVRRMLGPRWGSRSDTAPRLSLEFLPATSGTGPAIVSTSGKDRRMVRQFVELAISPNRRFSAALDPWVAAAIRSFNSLRDHRRLTINERSLEFCGSRSRFVGPAIPCVEEGQNMFAQRRVVVGVFAASDLLNHIFRMAGSAGFFVSTSYLKDGQIVSLTGHPRGSVWLSVNRNGSPQNQVVFGKWCLSGRLVFDFADIARTLNAFKGAIVQMRVPVEKSAEPPWVEFVNQDIYTRIELLQAIET